MARKRLPPIDREVKEEFRKYVEDVHGGARGHFREEVETALREYMNAFNGGDTHDRLKRIERDIGDIKDTLSENDSDGRTDSVSKRTENRINDIMADIQRRAEELGTKRVPENDVEAAIERNAGTSYKTIQRYKSLLTNQRELFPHPENDDVYFTKATAFVVFVENTLPSKQASEVVNAYGSDWWEENAPDGFLSSTPERGLE